MSEPSKMLTQEEIDAMLAKGVAKKAALSDSTTSHDSVSSKVQTVNKPSTSQTSPIEAIPAVSKSTTSSTVQKREREALVAVGESGSLNAKMAELSSRIAELEASARGIEDMRSQLRVVAEALKNTPGYNIHKTFNCSHCGSDGIIAVKVWCTGCGQSQWLGWWPEEE